jgi:hypothetical protein
MKPQIHPIPKPYYPPMSKTPLTLPRVVSTNTDHEASKILEAFNDEIEHKMRVMDGDLKYIEAKVLKFELDVINRHTTQEIQTERCDLQRRERDIRDREQELYHQQDLHRSVHWREQAVLRCWHCGFKSHLSPDCYATIDIQGYVNRMEYRYRPV